MFINLSFNHIASPSGFYLIWTLLRKVFDHKKPLQGLTPTQELRYCKIWRLHTQNLRINKKAWFNSSKRGLSKNNLIKKCYLWEDTANMSKKTVVQEEYPRKSILLIFYYFKFEHFKLCWYRSSYFDKHKHFDLGCENKKKHFVQLISLLHAFALQCLLGQLFIRILTRGYLGLSWYITRGLSCEKG